MKKLLLTILLLSTIFHYSAAQRQMSLEQCQQQALENNTKIKQSQLSQHMADEQRLSARAHYLPTVEGSYSAFRASDDLVTITIPQLGSLGMINDGVVGALTATLPLYAGGQIHNSNRLAEIGRQVSRLQLSQSQSEVKETTAQYFWQVVLLKEKLNTLDVIDHQLQELHRNVEAAVEAGLTLSNDLLQVQLKQNELASIRLQTNNALSLSRMLLAQYIGLGLDSIDAAAQINYTQLPSPSALYLSPSAALETTSELGLLRQNLNAQKIEQRLAVGRNLPTLAVGGGYNHINLMERGQNFWMGFMTLKVPISSWIGGTHDIKRQRIAVEKARLSLADNAELLQIQMQSKWNTLNESYRQIDIALTSITQSEENLRVQRDRYDNGVILMSDLLEAQTLYQKARDQFVDSFVRYQIAQAQYLKATGR